VEKVALSCNPVSGGTLSCTAIEIIKWVKQRCLRILRHGITGFKEQLKLVNGFER
jgi:hypothetical protein